MRISEIADPSKLDPEIVKAVEKVNQNSWEATDKNVFYQFCLELSTLRPMMLRGNKIVILLNLRSKTLELAHEGHPGETVMKRRLRAKVWRSLIDREAEKFVKKCRDCLMVMQPIKPPPMSRHKFPEGPWQYLAIYHMDPSPNQKMVFVVIDYYSRYQELKFLKQTTSSVIIQHLTEIFLTLGLPKSIRADNGAQFISQEFRRFCKENNIELIHTTPYWPQANAEVENMNKCILKRLQIGYANDRNLQMELQEFTLMHNVTPHGTTKMSLSEMMFNRNKRDKILSILDINDGSTEEEARENNILNKQRGKGRWGKRYLKR
ncbi:uncharacterized protein K02A2.6-like [Belonocnema kinseyi]|uniref:uncharacterized protein K02A2.6-like n=1 Tax=Belonocnema kinseyi TaxID=2817044 RepID=UPI00143DEE9A|nr:uncharacterized protein K02A2.6-like [Belonocnema kinseyi]